jgi:hypothetical protein
MAKAKARGRAVVGPPVALVLAHSTPTTDARSRVSGSGAPKGTSHTARTDRVARLFLLGEEGSDDRADL